MLKHWSITWKLERPQRNILKMIMYQFQDWRDNECPLGTFILILSHWNPPWHINQCLYINKHNVHQSNPTKAKLSKHNLTKDNHDYNQIFLLNINLTNNKLHIFISHIWDVMFVLKDWISCLHQHFTLVLYYYIKYSLNISLNSNFIIHSINMTAWWDKVVIMIIQHLVSISRTLYN